MDESGRRVAQSCQYSQKIVDSFQKNFCYNLYYF